MTAILSVGMDALTFEHLRRDSPVLEVRVCESQFVETALLLELKHEMTEMQSATMDAALLER
jgi:hypothetical protein